MGFPILFSTLQSERSAFLGRQPLYFLMHPSEGSGAGRGEGLAEAEHEVGVVESQFPESEVAGAEHQLGLEKPF